EVQGITLLRGELIAIANHWTKEILDLKAHEEAISIYGGSTERRIDFWKKRILYVESVLGENVTDAAIREYNHARAWRNLRQREEAELEVMRSHAVRIDGPVAHANYPEAFSYYHHFADGSVLPESVVKTRSECDCSPYFTQL